MYGGQHRVSRTKRPSLSARPPAQQAMAPQSAAAGADDDSVATSRSAASNWQTKRRPPSSSDESSESKSWASEDIKAAAAARMSVTTGTKAPPTAATAGLLIVEDDYLRNQRGPADPLGIGWSDGVDDSDRSSLISDAEREHQRYRRQPLSNGAGGNMRSSAPAQDSMPTGTAGRSSAGPKRDDASPTSSGRRSPRQVMMESQVTALKSEEERDHFAQERVDDGLVGPPARTPEPGFPPSSSSPRLSVSNSVPMSPPVPLREPGRMGSQSSQTSSARGKTSTPTERPAIVHNTLPTSIPLTELPQWGGGQLSGEKVTCACGAVSTGSDYCGECDRPLLRAVNVSPREHEEALLPSLVRQSSPPAEASTHSKERSSSNNDDWPDTDDDRRDDSQNILPKQNFLVSGQADDVFVPPPREAPALASAA